MPLVAIDTMILDELADVIDVDQEWADMIEAQESPPGELAPEPLALYWLVTMAPAWTSCLYTFSDRLYDELEAMPPEKARKAWRLLELAMEVRENHPLEARHPDPRRRPETSELESLGLRSADAAHVADAIGMDACHFLTLDRGILRRSGTIFELWGLRVQTPRQFLLSAVRDGAPWPIRVPWPWEPGEPPT